MIDGKQRKDNEMKYKLAHKYDKYMDKMMGPNPIKLQEELLEGHNIPKGATVMDLGSGQGLTSVFLVKEYGFRVFATDLWSDPTDNMEFFRSTGLDTDKIIPIHADANDLPYAKDFFDAVVSTDSYNYFGREKDYLGQKLLPYVKRGGYIYISVPGMKKDCHDNLPKELLLSWTPEQMDYIHDALYWERLIRQTEGVDILSIHEMESNEEAWADWLACDNEYAVEDRAAMEAGGGRYMNFIGMILKRQ
jgi:cyclopropane fatty-acyl-phospholipid synthase-like methyltransferase